MREIEDASRGSKFTVYRGDGYIARATGKLKPRAGGLMTVAG